MTNVGSKRGSGLLRAEGQKQGGLRGGGANTWQGVWHGKKGGSLKSKKKYIFFFCSLWEFANRVDEEIIARKL